MWPPQMMGGSNLTAVRLRFPSHFVLLPNGLSWAPTAAYLDCCQRVAQEDWAQGICAVEPLRYLCCPLGFLIPIWSQWELYGHLEHNTIDTRMPLRFTSQLHLTPERLCRCWVSVWRPWWAWWGPINESWILTLIPTIILVVEWQLISLFFQKMLLGRMEIIARVSDYEQRSWGRLILIISEYEKNSLLANEALYILRMCVW